MTALRATATAHYAAPATPKTIVIPTTGTGGAVAVGDVIMLQWSGGAAPTLDASFTGWTTVATGLSGSAVLWSRLAQLADIGRTVTVEAGGGATKVDLAITVLSSVDQVTPVAVSNSLPDAGGTSPHTGPTLAMGSVSGKVVQFYFSKEPNASSARSIGGAYTVAVNDTNGSATNAQVNMSAISNADVTGSIAAAVWTIDQPSSNVFMVAVGFTPVSTTIGVFPQTDVTLPSGAVINGGSTAAAVLADSDDNTYVGFGVSGSAVHLIERFGSSGTPLQGPLQQFTLRVLMNGATSVVVVPTLRNGTTPINAQASHTFSADGSFTWTISSPDQAAQVDLTNVQVDFSITGS